MGKQKYSKEEKEKILKEAEEEGVREVSRRYGIHFTTVYEWKKSFKSRGKELPSRSGGHNKGRREIEEWKREEVLKEKVENPGYGASQIRNQLRRRGITISILTIERVLEDSGYNNKKKKGKQVKEVNRFEATRPLELVQIDIMEFYIHKVKVYLVILLDDYSRFILNFCLSTRYTMEEIQGMVEESIQRYGKMEKILSDRGFVFHGWKGINRFEKYLEEQGIYHIHTSAHHPETIGKVERVNRSIQKELIRVKEFKDIAEATKEVGIWIWKYNYKRVHQGLGGVMVPADRFHGWSREIDKGLSKMAEEGISVEGREVNLFQIKMVDSHLEFMVMGKKLLMEVTGLA